MVRRVRDYAAEYARRIARGLSRGLTRSQARGHPRPREPSVYQPAATYDPHLEEGVRLLREGRSATKAAKSIGIAPERFRSYLTATGVGEKRKGRWVMARDLRRREVATFSQRRIVKVILRGFDEASNWGAYMAAVGQLLDNNNRDALSPFKGQGVTDIDGTFWPFEVDPNTLYRLNLAGPEPYEQIYRIVT